MRIILRWLRGLVSSELAVSREWLASRRHYHEESEL